MEPSTCSKDLDKVPAQHLRFPHSLPPQCIFQEFLPPHCSSNPLQQVCVALRVVHTGSLHLPCFQHQLSQILLTLPHLKSYPLPTPSCSHADVPNQANLLCPISAWPQAPAAASWLAGWLHAASRSFLDLDGMSSCGLLAPGGKPSLSANKALGAGFSHTVHHIQAS